MLSSKRDEDIRVEKLRKDLSEYLYASEDILELSRFILCNSGSFPECISEKVNITNFFNTVKRVYGLWRKNPAVSVRVDYDLLALLTLLRASDWLDPERQREIEGFITDLTDGYTNWNTLFPVKDLRVVIERSLRAQVTGIVRGRNCMEIWFREGSIGSSQVSGMVIISPFHIQIKDIIDGGMYIYIGDQFPMSTLDLEDLLTNCPKLWIYRSSVFPPTPDDL
ncbi:hypothetical protein FG386_000462 [Cryptosporidium ryanae]|uniref:uncharacterized protein n=1 Tax=Cryptosporidium ryanae TaxID=515981 RepID=UPI00351A7EE0|nr:hypothetical protein FG386_000462 [Cryptosporidium ryanae]